MSTVAHPPPYPSRTCATFQMDSSISSAAPSPAHQEKATRRTIRTSLLAWSSLALAPQCLQPAPHHRRIIAELEALHAGGTDRLMLLLPPGSAKSTYASLLFPPWWLAANPAHHIITASHTASLAHHFGRGVRALVAEHASRLGYALSPHSRAAHRFSTSAGGTYYATSVRGPVTGRRADLILIDDPIKSSLEADSAPARDRLWDWYRSDLLTRLRPGGRIVLVMTRWHPDDLGGRLLAGSDTWCTLRLPALAEPDDPLGRNEGQPLWPEWEGVESINRKRLALGDRAFAALFQQSPTAPGGRLFRPDRITIRDDDPSGPSVRAWDLAASTRGNPDWTVGLRLVRTDQGFHVADVVRLQGEPHAVEAAILRTAELDGRTVPISLPQDPGQAGRHQATWLAGRLAGYRVDASPETGSKEIRASPVASQVNAGNLSLARAAWNGPFLEELQDFPAGAKDDQVDALSRAFAHLVNIPVPARHARMSLLGR